MTGFPSSPMPSSSGPGSVPGPFLSLSVTFFGFTTNPARPIVLTFTFFALKSFDCVSAYAIAVLMIPRLALMWFSCRYTFQNLSGTEWLRQIS